MTRKEQIDLLCRIPIGTALVVNDEQAAGIVGFFAGLGLRNGADTLKLTGGVRMRAELGPDASPRAARGPGETREQVPELLLDDLQMIAIPLRDRMS